MNGNRDSDSARREPSIVASGGVAAVVRSDVVASREKRQECARVKANPTDVFKRCALSGWYCSYILRADRAILVYLGASHEQRTNYQTVAFVVVARRSCRRARCRVRAGSRTHGNDQ